MTGALFARGSRPETVVFAAELSPLLDAPKVGTRMKLPHDEISDSKRLADYLRFEVKA